MRGTGTAGHSWLTSEAHQAISQIADSKKAPLGAFLHWWVVQDDSLRSPFGPRRERLRCFAALNSNLLQVRTLSIADSKKAPLGRFFTLVGVQDSNLRPID